MFDLFIVSDITRRRVRDQFDPRPGPRNTAHAARAERPEPSRSKSVRPIRLLASLRAVTDR
jgi:hypothetical protein